MPAPHPPPVVLTVAGSDSGGGAGIQADLKTFHQWGVYGTSAVTAVTAQNTLGVQSIHPIPSPVVRQQIQSVAEDFHVAAVKTGMLASTSTVRAVAEGLRTHRLSNYVLDPVLVATSGDRLTEDDAIAAILGDLLPQCALVTPNGPEARLLTGVDDDGEEAMVEAARRLVELGAGAALVTGGHLVGTEVTDVFWDGQTELRISNPRIRTRHTHGTGCTLSAALTAGLALGLSTRLATEAAVSWVHRGIARAPGLGAGRGPVNHFVDVEQ